MADPSAGCPVPRRPMTATADAPRTPGNAPLVLPLPNIANLAALSNALARGSTPSLILESATPGGWSFLAWDPAATIDAQGRKMRTWKSPEVELPPFPSTPSQIPGFLERVLDRYRVAPGSGEDVPPFLGGFLGLVGYEWASRQEGPDREGPAGVPDLWFGLFDRAIAVAPSGRAQLVAVPSIRRLDAASLLRRVSTAISRLDDLPRPARTARFGSPVEDFSRARFEEAVRAVRKLIRQGDVYQANLAQRIRVRGADPDVLYERLRAINPSPFSALVSVEGFSLASSSPERLFRVRPKEGRSRTIETRPIAGTRPRAAGSRDLRNEAALRGSAKERAEHTMLVDLSRNDLGRVCEAGSVEVDEWMTVERYSHVMHLVSNVRGRLAPSVGLSELFRALMPGGSISGTPKIRATEVIAELEPVPRGAFTGSLGYLSLDGAMDFNLLIRSAFFPHGRSEAQIYAGAGIVQDSDPSREWRECRAKAAARLEAGRPGASRALPWAPPHLSARWSPPRVRARFPDRRVLLIDNYDSFTYNLAQYLSALGAHVEVVRNDSRSLRQLRSLCPTHVVLSPGPGRPKNSGISVAAVRAFEGRPILGVCLGLQAMAVAYGGSLELARRPVHGKATAIHRVRPRPPGDLLEGIPTDFPAGRYHSLVVNLIPSCMLSTAVDDEGQVMALQHRRFPTFGVQFHPESMLTPAGMSILSNFLATPSPELP